jgi:hypothetical protein
LQQDQIGELRWIGKRLGRQAAGAQTGTSFAEQLQAFGAGP